MTFLISKKETKYEGTNISRGPRHEIGRGNGNKTEADGRNRRVSYSVAHNEDLFALRV